MAAAVTVLAIGIAGMAGTIAYHLTGSGVIAASMAFGGANVAIAAVIAVRFIIRQ